MLHGFYLKSGQLFNRKVVSVLSFSNFWGIYYHYRFGCVYYRFPIKTLATNPISILYISPMTDKKSASYIGIYNIMFVAHIVIKESAGNAGGVGYPSTHIYIFCFNS